MSNIRNLATQEEMQALNADIDEKAVSADFHLYQHCLNLYNYTSDMQVSFIILSQSSAPMDGAAVIDYLRDNGFTGSGANTAYFYCTGSRLESDYVYSISRYNNVNYRFAYFDITDGDSYSLYYLTNNTPLSDTVIQLF